MRIKEDFLNSFSLTSNSVVFRLRNRADRFLRFNLEHIVSLFLERIKLIYNTVVYLHYRLARGTPHACIKSHRSTPVTIDHCSCKLPSVWHFARRPCSPRVIRYLHISKRLYHGSWTNCLHACFCFFLGKIFGSGWAEFVGNLREREKALEMQSATCLRCIGYWIPFIQTWKENVKNSHIS